MKNKSSLVLRLRRAQIAPEEPQERLNIGMILVGLVIMVCQSLAAPWAKDWLRKKHWSDR